MKCDDGDIPNTISVIIPSLNEEKRIANVVSNVPRDLVTEILVVDGFSTDETIKMAKEAGADRIILQDGEGKGSALLTGLKQAKGDIVVFWDADIMNTQAWMFYKLLEPVLNGFADFVKANYSETPGRVACLATIPLLKRYFPEVARFGQPLSGEIASYKDIILKLGLEPHFGVEVGLLIDVVMNRYKIVEVDLKRKEHKHQTLRGLIPMAEQVMATIFDRAKKYGRFQ